MLDQPYSFHTLNPNKPANHTTWQCTWMARACKEDGNLPPPPPLTGANTQSLPAQPAYAVNRDRQEGVLQINNSNNKNVGKGRNDYKEQHQSYVVFVTEPTDKQS